MIRNSCEKLWNSLMITREMMEYRGFEMLEEPKYSDYESMVKVFEDEDHIINKTVLDGLKHFYHKSENKPSKVGLVWLNHLHVDDTKDLYKYIISHTGCSSFVVVIRNKMTSRSKEIIKDMERVNNVNIELFYECDLQFNPLNHEAVPKHIICTNKVKKMVLTTYGVTSDKLPKIKSTDPIVKFMGATKGQLIKVVIPIPKEEIYKFEVKNDNPYYKIFYRVVV